MMPLRCWDVWKKNHWFETGLKHPNISYMCGRSTLGRAWMRCRFLAVIAGLQSVRGASHQPNL